MHPTAITRFRQKVAALSVGLSCSLFAWQVEAAGDPLIEGAKMCTRYLPRQEREFGIPVHLLAAIASTESGRYHDRLKMKVPWPWTINARGRGYFFETKEEAVKAAKKLIDMGIRSMDVGCMQVNLEHHPTAFTSLEDAFEPSSNVAYAAQFLRTNYDIDGSWKKAAASYHSRTPSRGSAYVQRVFGAWNNIINRVAQARGYSPEQAVEMASNYTGDYGAASFDKVQDIEASTSSTKTVKAQSASIPAREPSFKAPRMKVIQVREEATKEKGVVVVRPKSAAAEDAEEASRKSPEAGKATLEEGNNKPVKAVEPEPQVAESPQPVNGRDQTEVEEASLSNEKTLNTEIQQVPPARQQAAAPRGVHGNRAKFIRLSGTVRQPEPVVVNGARQPRFIFDN